MLKRDQGFKAVNTHFDITPSLLAFLHDRYNFKIPVKATWMGSGLDTADGFRNLHTYPLMQTKNEIANFIMDDYMLHNDDLYKISDKVYLDPVENGGEKARLQGAFNRCKLKNATVAAASPSCPTACCPNEASVRIRWGAATTRKLQQGTESLRYCLESPV